jgi:serine phosphatase RsbU (regulator of sigma subunit)
LRQTIRDARDCPAEEVISRLYKAVKDFSRGTEQADDLTAVVLKRKNTVPAQRDEAVQNELVAVS